MLEEPLIEPRSRRKTEGRLVVLKLGGSVITEKEKPMTPNPKAMQRLAKEIAEARVEHLIIVHGGGSFGHPIARKYNIKEGFRKPSQIEGFSRTHQAMLELNNLVMDALLDHGIRAFSISPSSCIITKAGRILSFYNRSLIRLLDSGLVPVLFGDAIPDKLIGFTILSGDQLVAVLAKKFRADKVILGVDVNGLYTSDPKTDSSAKLISNITLHELKTLLNIIEKPKASDVTGGMWGKIFELIPAINAEIPTMIINAAQEDNVYKALAEEKTGGTLIEKE